MKQYFLKSLLLLFTWFGACALELTTEYTLFQSFMIMAVSAIVLNIKVKDDEKQA